MPAHPKGLIIAAPASGSGKTVVTLGIARALRQQGYGIRAAKVGPDYLDPAFHAAATGAPCVSLDTWAMRETTLTGLIERLDGDLALVEGVMGLFDGADCTSPLNGSTASLARVTGWPVVLVLDVTGQAASSAAVARGFCSHDPAVRVAGVILNRVAGDRHAHSLRRAFADTLPALPVLGCVPRTASLALPHRHLGLVQASEQANLEAILDAAATVMTAHLDLAALIALATPAALRVAGSGGLLPPLGQRLALASDAAFAFHYPAQSHAWQAMGGQIMPFSPLANEAPDPSADAILLPGGYPELHAGRLAAAGQFLGGLRQAAERGVTIHGECGGYMVLGRALLDGSGVPHAMAGLLPVVTSFATRRLHLGYRRAVSLRAASLRAASLGVGPWSPGQVIRGHEFHYATIVEESPEGRLFQVADASGHDLGAVGLRRGSVSGSFIHAIDCED